MKTVLKTLSTLFLAVLAVQAIALPRGEEAHRILASVEEGNLKYSIYAVNNTNKIKFSFEKTADSHVTVQIYNANFDLLYTQKIRKENEGSIGYNLEALGGGTYHVKVSASDFVKVHTFEVGKYSYENTFMPYISTKKDDNKVHVAFQNAFAPVSIQVYDVRGNVYHTQKIADQTSHHQVLNVSQLPAGEYTVEVSSQGKATRQAIRIE